MKDFNQSINKIYRKRKDRPQLILKRIDKFSRIGEEYKTTSKKYENRTRKQYYYGIKYDIISVCKFNTWALKSASYSNYFIKIVPPNTIIPFIGCLN